MWAPGTLMRNVCYPTIWLPTTRLPSPAKRISADNRAMCVGAGVLDTLLRSKTELIDLVSVSLAAT